jgi:hypothetical protein
MSENLYNFLCMSMGKDHSLPTGYSLYVMWCKDQVDSGN